MDHFYIVLPSNCSNKLYNNTSSNYTIKLPKPLILSSDWVVGLADISYTYRWYNLDNEVIKVKYYNNGVIDKKEMLINEGFYSIDRLLGILNEKMKKLTGTFDSAPKLTLVNVESIRKIKIRFGLLNGSLVFPELSQSLCNILGINKEILDDRADAQLLNYVIQAELEYKSEGTDKKDWKPKIISDEQVNFTTHQSFDITNGIHTLFVYSDVIKPQYVGDTLTQLLRHVEIPNDLKFSNQVHLKYDEIQYHKVFNDNIETIEIDIRDDAGENIKFSHAQTVVVLHFKKVI